MPQLKAWGEQQSGLMDTYCHRCHFVWYVKEVAKKCLSCAYVLGGYWENRQVQSG